MIEPVLTCISLINGILTFAIAICTTIMIYKGSKSKFAYIQLAFAFGFGLHFLSVAVYNYFPVKVTISDKNYFLPNFYAFWSASAFYFLLSLQQWLFSMKYLQIAFIVQCKPKLTDQHLKFIKWTVICIYSI